MSFVNVIEHHHMYLQYVLIKVNDTHQVNMVVDYNSDFIKGINGSCRRVLKV